MELQYFYHRNANLLIKYDKDFSTDFVELTNTLKNISENELIETFKKEKLTKPSVKGLSTTINKIIKDKLIEKQWNTEVGIFKTKPYSDKNKTRWRLDFVKNNISVEVAFNHQEATAHNILKPVLASELNHVQKEIQTRLGVIIVSTKEMKNKGNFDSAIGTFESFKDYFKPYNNIITTPIVLVGINPPNSFYINKKTKEVTINNSSIEI